jgi:acetoin utilization protein AcuB
MRDVQSWMTREPRTVGPETSALEALELMIEGGFRHLPVVTGRGALAGIVSIDDLRAALPFRVALRAPVSEPDRSAALEWAVGELMTYAPFSVRPDASLEQAARELVRRRIGCLPVVDESGALAGILSESDALTALATLLKGEGRREPERLGELEHFARELRAERRRVLGQLGQREAVERELSAQEHDEPMDFADHALRTSAVALEGALAELAARRLAEINRGLDRHARGELGVCVTCGARIALARLRARPGTDSCIRCQEKKASGAARPGA